MGTPTGLTGGGTISREQVELVRGGVTRRLMVGLTPPLLAKRFLMIPSASVTGAAPLGTVRRLGVTVRITVLFIAHFVEDRCLDLI
jgi:hypothetical protein